MTGLLVVGFVAIALAASAVAQSAKISFLHINDVYEFKAKRGVGGMAELQTLLKAERAKGHMTVTTLGGDLISPSVMSGLTKGSQMIAMMNAIGVDYAGLGNHEFDFGDDVLKQRLAESNSPGWQQIPWAWTASPLAVWTVMPCGKLVVTKSVSFPC